MATSQQPNRVSENEMEETQDDIFDKDTRDKSTDALFSLLTHLKRQDEESDY